MSPVYRQMDTKKPATSPGRGLAANVNLTWRPVAAQALLQLHSDFVRCRLLLGQAVDITAPQ